MNAQRLSAAERTRKVRENIARRANRFDPLLFDCRRILERFDKLPGATNELLGIRASLRQAIADAEK